MKTKKITIVGALLVLSILLIISPEKASSNTLELVVRTSNGPPTLTFKIRSISARVWEAHRSYIKKAYLTSESMYNDPHDLTVPGTYNGNECGWDTDGFPYVDSLKHALGRGIYQITVQALNGTDTLIVDCYGAHFLGDVVVYYNYIGNMGKGAFYSNGIQVDTIYIYDNPDGLQPTKPRNLNCNNANENSVCPNLEWNQPTEPRGVEFRYQIYRKGDMDEFEVIASNILDSSWADSTFLMDNRHGTFTYYVVAYTERSPDSELSEYVVIDRTISNIQAKKLIEVPKTYRSYAYPNPFNAETKITFRLPETSHVNIIIYSILGQQIRNLVSNYYETGSHSVSWDGKNDYGVDVASGVYLYHMQAGDFHSTKQICLVK